MRPRARLPIRPPRSSVVLLLLLATAPVPSRAQSPPTGREVMERYDAQDRTRDSEVTVDMTIENARGRSRERVLTLWSKTRDDGTRMQLIRFLEPADVEGTGFLQVENRDRDDDLWLYLPALRRVRRISGADRRDRFVGTDFTFEDLDPEDLDAHRYTFLRDDSVDGRPVQVVEAVATDPIRAEESGYGRRVLWIARERHVLLRADLYARDGALAKRLTAARVRQVADTDRWRPHRLVMDDLRRGGRTVLRMTSYVLDQGLPDELFTERYLRRGR